MSLALHDPRASGFTLVELLVVLALAALLGTAVLLTMPSDGQGATREADRLVARLVRAQQEAILGTRGIAVVVDARGHAVQRQGRGGWVELDAPPFEPVAWDPGTVPVPADRPVRFSFDATGGAEPATVAFLRAGTRIRISLEADGKVIVDAPGS